MKKLFQRCWIQISFMEVKEASEEVEIAKKQMELAVKKYNKAQRHYDRMYNLAMAQVQKPANDYRGRSNG